jgi:hypothetical protein
MFVCILSMISEGLVYTAADNFEGFYLVKQNSGNIVTHTRKGLYCKYLYFFFQYV